uniref:Nucleolar protein 6 n=1 Tax=Steinernema glaseri TaxID=37863 RepID=A0A1I7YL18_9BILA
MKRKAGKKSGVAKKKQKTTTDVIAEFNKSPFVLQCDDLLAENSFSAKTVDETDQFVSSIVKIIKNGKLSGKFPLVDTKWMESAGVVFPIKIGQKLIERMKSPVLDFEFKKPGNVEVIGDWKLGAALKSVDPEVVVDVEIPNEYFGQRDHLNFIYHVKRAHYACACAIILRKSLKNANVSFTAEADKPRNVDLVIERTVNVEDNAVTPRIRITFSVSTEAPFAALSRLLPSKNCLRSNFIDGKTSKNEGEDKPTPSYNKSIASDICRRTLSSKLAESLSKSDTIMKAYKLLKLWSARSGLLKRPDGITAECLAALLVLLDRKQIISDRMELTTVLSNVWKWLTETTFSEPLSLNEEADASPFQEVYSYVFLDFDGYTNLTSNLSGPALGRMQREAARAIKLLSSLDSFHHIFITELSFALLYDQYATITIPVPYLAQLKSGKFTDDLLDNCDNWLKIFIAQFLPTINKAWEDRIPYFDLMEHSSSFRREWALNALQTDRRVPLKISLGMELQNGWDNPITRGPVANTPEGAEFRKFWGERSELRKFADNTICEAIVWAENGAAVIPVVVLRHVLERHFDLAESAVLNSVVPEKLLANPKHFEVVNKAYDQLSKHLRNAKDLPLGVSNINPISAALRRTDPYPPLPKLAPTVPETDDSSSFALPHILKELCPLVPTIDVKITLEKSGRWADEIDAIAKLKTAFYIEIGRCLENQFHLKCYPQRSCLYVIMEKSIVFALEIVCPKEVTILKKIAGKKDGIPKDCPASRQIEKEDVYRPQLCSSLLGTSNQFSSFGETCQLVRQWISSQYLLGHFDPVVVELLVAHVYLSPVGFAAPLTPYKGFVHFLNLLVDHNWLMKPLFVDFTNTWSDEDVYQLSQNFLKMRAVLPPMVIITPDDAIGSRFTRGLPQPIILKRIMALAANALKIIVATESGANLNSLFTCSTGAYDLLITVNPKSIAPRLTTRPAKKPQNKKGVGKVLPVVGFDPESSKAEDSFLGNGEETSISVLEEKERSASGSLAFVFVVSTGSPMKAPSISIVLRCSLLERRLEEVGKDVGIDEDVLDPETLGRYLQVLEEGVDGRRAAMDLRDPQHLQWLLSLHVVQGVHDRADNVVVELHDGACSDRLNGGFRTSGHYLWTFGVVATPAAVAYFFYDHFNPSKIGIIWKPTSIVKEVNITNCLHRFVSGGEAPVNREAVIEDIRIMGVGLIEEIRTK